MLHYCIDDENDQTASACGCIFADSLAATHLTQVASDVQCSTCMRWMKKRGMLPGDRGKLVKFVVHLDEEDGATLRLMSREAGFTDAELLRQLIRRAANDRRSLLEPEQE